MIYMDNAATRKMTPAVIQTMRLCIPNQTWMKCYVLFWDL